jgi:hypothetical protein
MAIFRNPANFPTGYHSIREWLTGPPCPNTEVPFDLNRPPMVFHSQVGRCPIYHLRYYSVTFNEPISRFQEKITEGKEFLEVIVYPNGSEMEIHPRQPLGGRTITTQPTTQALLLGAGLYIATIGVTAFVYKKLSKPKKNKQPHLQSNKLAAAQTQE